MTSQADRLDAQLLLNSAPDIVSTFTRILEQHAQMEQALMFYANRDHYEIGTTIEDDCGRLARIALNLELH